VALCLLLAGVAAITSHLRCVDAAREAARLLARGDPDKARQAVDHIAPSGASVRTSVNGDHIEVEVSAGSLLPGLTVSGQAFAVAEPQEAG
jgi:hypothetical protein